MNCFDVILQIIWKLIFGLKFLFFTGSESSQDSILKDFHQASMDEVIQLLRQLFIVTTKNHSVPIEAFNSKRITNKLVQQIQDSLVLASNGLPDWCHDLTSTCPMVFPFETRLLYFQCTAFGASRSIGNIFYFVYIF